MTCLGRRGKTSVSLNRAAVLNAELRECGYEPRVPKVEVWEGTGRTRGGERRG
jgi:hypothetical protein